QQDGDVHDREEDRAEDPPQHEVTDEADGDEDPDGSHEARRGPAGPGARLREDDRGEERDEERGGAAERADGVALRLVDDRVAHAPDRPDRAEDDLQREREPRERERDRAQDDPRGHRAGPSVTRAPRYTSADPSSRTTGQRPRRRRSRRGSRRRRARRAGRRPPARAR